MLKITDKNGNPVMILDDEATEPRRVEKQEIKDKKDEEEKEEEEKSQ